MYFSRALKDAKKLDKNAFVALQIFLGSKALPLKIGSQHNVFKVAVLLNPFIKRFTLCILKFLKV